YGRSLARTGFALLARKSNARIARLSARSRRLHPPPGGRVVSAILWLRLRSVSQYGCYMAAIEDFSDDFPQYLANTARELAESSKRSLRKLEEERVIIVGLQRRTELAAQALCKSASALSDISDGLHDASRGLRDASRGLRDACGDLRDYSETSCDDMNRAIEALNQSREESKDDMRRMAEMSDLLAAFLSASQTEEPEPEDEDPEPEPEDEDPE
ncbi:MAG: hypothetical protein OXP08_02735, partial [bacterium]|nr:hypothetical protein [bacterium]